MLNLDTHILIYALSGDLSDKERKLLESKSWSISQIVLWEITKLVQLKRLDLELESMEVKRILNRIQQWPISLEVCSYIPKLDFRSDPADEIIAATSIAFQVPLLTRDKKILKSKKVPLVRK